MKPLKELQGNSAEASRNLEPQNNLPDRMGLREDLSPSKHPQASPSVRYLTQRFGNLSCLIWGQSVLQTPGCARQSCCPLRLQFPFPAVIPLRQAFTLTCTTVTAQASGKDGHPEPRSRGGAWILVSGILPEFSHGAEVLMASLAPVRSWLEDRFVLR